MGESFKFECNGVELIRDPKLRYNTNYWKMLNRMQAGEFSERDLYCSLITQDLWFIVYFVLKIPVAHCQFWIDACRDVQKGPGTLTLDLWGREAGKTSIITTAETIQRILNNPEERIGVFSYAKTPAQGIVRAIKSVFEGSDFLKWAFPGVLWQDPQRESPKWSEEAGIVVRRKGFYREATLEAHGLIEGMPVGKHFSGRIYDDVETADLVYTPEIMQRLKDQFNMSQFLGTDGGWHRVIGTPYHHEGLLMYLAEKESEGQKIYHIRKKPGTVDGEPNGEPTYLSHKRMAELRATLTRQEFFSQILLDPTPKGTELLNPQFIKEVDPHDLPSRLYKFIAIDPAGMRKDRVGDSWAIVLAGVEPYRDDLGASNVYILNAVCQPMTETEALNAIGEMYLKGGMVRCIGVEKVGMMTAEVHIANYLRAKGRTITIENGGLVLLRPAGRAKQDRIVKNLEWPLNNGKLFVSTGVPAAYRARLRLEMEKFPYWHDDFLDALSYVYDMLKDLRFGKRDMEGGPGKPKDAWADAFKKAETNNTWLTV